MARPKCNPLPWTPAPTRQPGPTCRWAGLCSAREQAVSLWVPALSSLTPAPHFTSSTFTPSAPPSGQQTLLSGPPDDIAPGCKVLSAPLLDNPYGSSASARSGSPSAGPLRLTVTVTVGGGLTVLAVAEQEAILVATARASGDLDSWVPALCRLTSSLELSSSRWPWAGTSTSPRRCCWW